VAIFAEKIAKLHY